MPVRGSQLQKRQRGQGSHVLSTAQDAIR